MQPQDMAMAQPSETALFPKVANPQKRAVLAAYVACGRISYAATAAKVPLRLHYYWKKFDPDYLDAWQTAQQMVGELLEEEAVRRAHEGVVRTKWYKDEKIGEDVEYSDTLLIFLLKGAMPEKYRERFEHSGDVRFTLVQDALARIAEEAGLSSIDVLAEAQALISERASS